MNRLKWLLLTVYLVALSLRRGSIVDDFEVRALAFPLENIRESGQIVSAVLLLLFVFIPTKGKWAFRLDALSVGVILHVLLSLYLSLRIMQTGRSVLWWQELALAAGVVYVFGLEVPTWIRRPSDLDDAVVSIGNAGVLWAVVSLYQYQVGPEAAVWGGRFLGISSHPQFAAVYLAITCSTLVYMFISRWRAKAKWGMIYSLLGLALCLAELAATQSRTGFVAVAIGCLFMLLKLRRAVILAAGIALASILMVLVNNPLAALDSESRLISGENTRREAWSVMASKFAASPIFGVGLNVEFSEGSLLRIAATGGVVGLVLAFGIMFHLVSTLRWISRHRMFDQVPPFALAVSAFAAITATILGAALFEGVLMEKFSLSITVYIMTMAVLAKVKRDLILHEPGQRRRIPSNVES